MNKWVYYLERGLMVIGLILSIILVSLLPLQLSPYKFDAIYIHDGFARAGGNISVTLADFCLKRERQVGIQLVIFRPGSTEEFFPYKYADLISCGDSTVRGKSAKITWGVPCDVKQGEYEYYINIRHTARSGRKEIRVYQPQGELSVREPRMRCMPAHL